MICTTNTPHPACHAPQDSTNPALRPRTCTRPAPSRAAARPLLLREQQIISAHCLTLLMVSCSLDLQSKATQVQHQAELITPLSCPPSPLSLTCFGCTGCICEMRTRTALLAQMNRKLLHNAYVAVITGRTCV